MITVKHADTHDITLTVNADLTGATTRLLARLVTASDAPTVLAHDVTDATTGTITHTLTGTLDVGEYNVELEITQDGKVSTAPTNDFLRLLVKPDLG